MRLRRALVAKLRRLRTDDLAHHLPRDTEAKAVRLARLALNEVRATDLRNRLHYQHPRVGPHENGSQSGPSVRGSRLDADHPQTGSLFRAETQAESERGRMHSTSGIRTGFAMALAARA